MRRLASARALCSSLVLFAGLMAAGCATANPTAINTGTPLVPASPVVENTLAATTAPKPTNTATASPAAQAAAENCPVTQPEWVKPPEDAAAPNEPAFGNYYLNRDRSIWVGAYWADNENYVLRVDKNGIKVGWFRPAGETLVITGKRIDGDAPPLASHVPCCYPTRFQATGLYFPKEGCWQVTGRAASSEIVFYVRVLPEAE